MAFFLNGVLWVICVCLCDVYLVVPLWLVCNIMLGFYLTFVVYCSIYLVMGRFFLDVALSVICL